MGPATQAVVPPTQILIAMNGPTEAQHLCVVLDQAGYQTRVVSSGLAALELASGLHPSLIICDVDVPGINGYELAHRVKQDAGLAGIAVFLATSTLEPEDVIRGLQRGVDSFILKPYDEAMLLGRVKHAAKPRSTGRTPDPGGATELYLGGRVHRIGTDPLQALRLLLSVCDAETQRNRGLSLTQQALRHKTAELSSANRFLDSIIENIPDMIFIKDAADLKFVRFNRAGEELLGYSRDQLLGKNDHDFFPKDESDYFVAKDREVLASGGRIDIAEEPIQTADKGTRLLHTKKVAVLDEHGVATHLLGISEDVTRQREMEREILDLNMAMAERARVLEASNKDLESFSHYASHDLRSPLSVISGYAKLLEEIYAGSLDAKGLRYLSGIRNNVKLMGALVDGFLAFSTLRGRAIAKGHVNMSLLVQEVFKEVILYQPDSKIPHIHLGALPSAQADATLTRQVWVNLISNAVKYSSKRESPVIEIGASTSGAETTYWVRDNGAGFSMDHYDKLFEVFQRLHSEEEFHGSGIGLSIVQRVVTRHGGRVWAEGKVDEGATFFFTLPHDPAQKTEPQAEQPAGNR